VTDRRMCWSSLFLIVPLTFLVVPEAYATTINWNVDAALVYGPITDISPYWAASEYWDVKGFYTWQNGVISIWIGDWEHDYYEGTTVGAVRQGSVWDSTAPWYDYPPAYQPTALYFGSKSTITLSSRVRIDNESRTPVGWINWLFNPWFRVMSTFAGSHKRKEDGLGYCMG
jgi:hypothetical protein